MIDGENNPSALVPLLEKMPYDAVNVGNHELYSKRNIDYMTQPGGYVDWWGDRYLTSNVHIATTSTDQSSPATGNNFSKNKHSNSNNKSLGNRYKILHGSSGRSRLLVFGFLYNLVDYNQDAGIEVEKVESAVAQTWFLNALKQEHYDAILVLAHMDLLDPLVETICGAIRDAIGDDMPVVFITGHTHYRGVRQLEDATMTFEAGRFMDTVGFVSFPRWESVRSGNAASLFQHKFLDANRKVLFEETLGFHRARDGETKNGKELSQFIDRTRQKMGLEQEIGCAPRSYYVERHVDHPESLWGLYRDQVIPKVFSVKQTMMTIEEEATHTEDNLPMAMLLNKDAWRYDLLSNATLVVDDIVAVAPFNDTVVHLGTFTREVILKANETLNVAHQGTHDLKWLSTLPKYILIDNLDDFDTFTTSTANGPGTAGTSIAPTKYHLYTHEFGAGIIKGFLERLAPKETVEIRKTEFTSTIIWLAFVQEFWTCSASSRNNNNGNNPIIPSNFLPSYQNAITNEKGEIDRIKLLVAIFVLLILVGILSTCVAILWISLQKYLSYQPIMGGEEEDSVSCHQEEDGICKVDGNANINDGDGEWGKVRDGEGAVSMGVENLEVL